MRYLIVLILMPLIQLGIALLGKSFLMTQHSFSAVYGLVLIQQICSVFLPTYLLFRKEKYLPKKEFHISRFSKLIRFAFIGITLQFIGIALNLPLGVLLQKWGYKLPSTLPLAKTPLQFAAQTVVVCLIPAIFEEVLFRRMIFHEIKKQSAFAAILFSALFFSMAHLDFFNLPATFFIGCCLGVARFQGIPLILCIVTHFFVNFSASVLNLLLDNPTISNLIQHYLPIWVFIAFLIFISVFPKINEETKNSKNSENISKPFIQYVLALLKNPLFYGYCILFIILGVNQL